MFRARRAAQPQGPLRIDRSHPLGAICLLASVPGVDIGTGYASSFSAARNVRREGRTANFASTAGAAQLLKTFPDSRFTVLALARYTTQTLGYMAATDYDGTTEGYSFRVNAGAIDSVSFGGSASGIATVTPTGLAVGDLWMPWANAGAANVSEVQSVGWMSASTEGEASATVTLNARSTRTCFIGSGREPLGLWRQYDGEMAAVFVFSRWLTPAERQSLWDNPWQLFTPIERSLFVALPAPIVLNATPTATAAATAALTASIRFAAAPAVVATSTSTLAAPLLANAASVATASAALTASIRAAAAPAAQAAVTAALTASIRLATAAAAVASTTSSLAAPAALTANAASAASVTAALTVTPPIILAHFDGTLANENGAGPSITLTGGSGAALSVTTPKFGSGQLSDGAFTTGPIATGIAGAGDFSADFWFWSTNNVASMFVEFLHDFNPIQFLVQRLSTDIFNVTGTSSTAATGFTTNGAWNHYEFSRNGGTLRVFKNGALVTSLASTSALSGAVTLNVSQSLGRVDEFRVAVGAGSGHTTTFTAPTTAYTSIVLAPFASDGAASAAASAALSTGAAGVGSSANVGAAAAASSIGKAGLGAAAGAGAATGALGDPPMTGASAGSSVAAAQGVRGSTVAISSAGTGVALATAISTARTTGGAAGAGVPAVRGATINPVAVAAASVGSATGVLASRVRAERPGRVIIVRTQGTP